ncbi:hypothetical protein [Flavobacterium wongokense]|uniref:hypothetical protein n=1 Tax=Flavobacterium wongokense TaxID=2910674 RepID=UPI001F3D3D8A|nr:hypothetical protein [Flavobacterium sp. WG47]MCF6132508.1 hypothetical protein [Flavobacterium sp. WG47]
MAKTRFVQQNAQHDVTRRIKVPVQRGHAMVERIYPEITNPPGNEIEWLNQDNGEGGYSIRMYLKYDYLQVKDFALLIANINDLYELVYFMLYEKEVGPKEMLVINHVKTGQSIYTVFSDLVKNSPKKVKIALAVTVGLLIGIDRNDHHNQAVANKQQTEQITSSHKRITDATERKLDADARKADAEARKADAEARKANAEAESVEFNNLLRKNEIDAANIKRINTPTNRKKISQKTENVTQIVGQTNFNHVEFNGNVVFNNANNVNNENNTNVNQENEGNTNGNEE